MQEIPRIKRRIQPRLVPRIRHDPRKIDHPVERTAARDPLVDPHPRLLAQRIRVRLDRVVGRTKGRDRRCKDGQAKGVHARDELLVGLDEAVADRLLGGGRGGRGTDVVDAFKDHDVFDPGLGEDVAVDAAEGVGAQTVMEDAVPAGCLVEDGDVGRERVLLHALEDEVGPATKERETRRAVSDHR